MYVPSSLAAQPLSRVFVQQTHQNFFDLFRHTRRVAHLLERQGEKKGGGEGRGGGKMIYSREREGGVVVD